MNSYSWHRRVVVAIRNAYACPHASMCTCRIELTDDTSQRAANESSRDHSQCYGWPTPVSWMSVTEHRAKDKVVLIKKNRRKTPARTAQASDGCAARALHARYGAGGSDSTTGEVPAADPAAAGTLRSYAATSDNGKIGVTLPADRGSE